MESVTELNDFVAVDSLCKLTITVPGHIYQFNPSMEKDRMTN